MYRYEARAGLSTHRNVDAVRVHELDLLGAIPVLPGVVQLDQHRHLL
jgi:hypothetical protein